MKKRFFLITLILTITLAVVITTIIVVKEEPIYIYEDSSFNDFSKKFNFEKLQTTHDYVFYKSDYEYFPKHLLGVDFTEVKVSEGSYRFGVKTAILCGMALKVTTPDRQGYLTLQKKLQDESYKSKTVNFNLVLNAYNEYKKVTPTTPHQSWLIITFAKNCK